MDGKFSFEWDADAGLLLAKFSGVTVNMEKTGLEAPPGSADIKQFALDTFLGMSEAGVFHDVPVIRMLKTAVPDLISVLDRYYEYGGGAKSGPFELSMVQIPIGFEDHADLYWHFCLKCPEKFSPIVEEFLTYLRIPFDFVDDEYRWIAGPAGHPLYVGKRDLEEVDPFED